MNFLAHPERRGSRDVNHNAWVAAAFAVALICVAWSAFAIAQKVSINSLREATTHRMAIYTASLQAEMKRFEYLPQVVALDGRIHAVLEHPEDVASQDAANNYLQTVSNSSGASAIYLMNRQGLTLAASNWNHPGSFVNMNFAYRPYFQEAVHGRPSRFYGIGTVSHEPGYYFGEAVTRNQSVLGVATVKVNLEKLDEAWRHESEKVFVVDNNGVIFLSSEPSWKYRTLNSLSKETMGRLAVTRQYSEVGLLSPLGVSQQRPLGDGSSIIRIRTEPIDGNAGEATDFMMRGDRIAGTDWRLVVMSDMTAASNAARSSAALAAVTLILVATLFLNFKQRRRISAQILATRSALQQANNELERKAEERTAALRDANGQLQGEISERMRAEETLRATLNDLVHTAKMAVLGQMSAGITHELNQPLTALRTLSSNTIIFLKRDQRDRVEANLQMIAHLTDHMGKITAQLKKFARKSAPNLQPVSLSSTVSDALFLLSQGVRISNVRIENDVASEDLMALCDANRIEQVFLNLLSNAIDAVENCPQPRIRISAKLDGAWVCIEVHDNGPGVSDEAALHLFEPFFSTKEQGMGLGLGLAISADIVRDLGGNLRAGTSEALGGALFTVTLQAVIREAAYV